MTNKTSKTIDADIKLIMFGWAVNILGLPENGNPDKYNELVDRLYNLNQEIMLGYVGEDEPVKDIEETSSMSDWEENVNEPQIRNTLRAEIRNNVKNGTII